MTEPKQYTCQGETHTISEWAQIKGISRMQILNRLRRGWPIEKALQKDYRNPNDAICWDCIHAIPNPEKGLGCSWSRKLIPVEGSEYKENHTGKEGKLLRITKCPKFERKGR